MTVPAATPPGTGTAPPGPAAAPPPWVYFPPTASALPYRRADAVSLFTEMFRAWGKDLLAYLGLSLLVGALTVGINVALFWTTLGVPWPTAQNLLNLPAVLGPQFATTYALVTIAAGLLGAVVTAWFTAVVTYFAICRRRGRPVAWSEALRMGSRRFPSVLVGALLLNGLLSVATGLDSALSFGSLQYPVSGAWLAASCGVLLLFPLFLFLWLSLLLYAPAILMEGVGAVHGLKRSWGLTRGRRLSIFGALILMGLVAAVILVVTLFVPILVGNALASILGEIVGTTIIGSWQVLLAAVAYELIGEEERDLQARQAFFRPAAQPPG